VAEASKPKRKTERGGHEAHHIIEAKKAEKK
jgi:hypothetical protein